MKEGLFVIWDLWCQWVTDDDNGKQGLITIHFYVHKPWKILYHAVCSWIIVHKCVDIFWLRQSQRIAIPTLYLFIAPILFRYQGFHWKTSSCLSPPIELAFSNNSTLPLCQPLSTAHHNYCASVILLTRVIVLLRFYTSLKYVVTVWLHLIPILLFVYLGISKRRH